MTLIIVPLPSVLPSEHKRKHNTGNVMKTQYAKKKGDLIHRVPAHPSPYKHRLGRGIVGVIASRPITNELRERVKTEADKIMKEEPSFLQSARQAA